MKILSQEALNVLFPLCLRMAKDPRLIPERLRPFVSLGPGSPPLERRTVGFVPSRLGLSFHKIVSSAIMTPHQKVSFPWSLFAPVQFGMASWAEQKTSCTEFRTLCSLTRVKSSCPSTSRTPSTPSTETPLFRPSRRSSPVFSAGRYKCIWEPIQAHYERMQTHQFSCGRQTR